MRKRGNIVALGVLLVLASVLAFLTSPQPAAAAGCCTSNDGCYADQYCAWPGGWSCGFVLGECTTLWPDQCGQQGYANDCTSDSTCGSGSYCSIGTKTEYVAADHICQYLSGFNECASCSYPTADCDYNSGCETNLASDANNCGSCGNTCDTGEMYK